MDLKTLLKETSEFTYHHNNTSKEYALLEDDRWLEIGKDCCIVDNRYLVLYTIEENKIISNIFKGKYTICYGISITNICSLLLRKNCDIISINRINEKHFNHYVLTVKKEYREVKSFIFRETWSLTDFESSDICQFILNELYR